MMFELILRIFIVALSTLVLSNYIPVSHAAPNKAKVENQSLHEAIKIALNKAGNSPGFSGTINASINGKDVFSISKGFADKNVGKSNDERTFFNGASTSKLFTAFILTEVLEEHGLPISTPVKKVLPNLNVASDLTIAHLLKHESNIPSIIDEQFTGQARKSAKTNADFYLAISQLIDTPIKPIGKGARYRNENYIIAGQIIEKLSGKTFEWNLRQLANESGAMEDIHIGKRAEIEKYAAIPYVHESFNPNQMRKRRKKPQLHTEYNTEYLTALGEQVTTAAGGLYMTGDGIVKMSSFIAKNSSRLNLLCQSNKLSENSGKTKVRGYGCIANHFGKEGNEYMALGHGGGAPGVQAVISFYPDFDLTLTVLSNHHGRATPVKYTLEEYLTNI